MIKVGFIDYYLDEWHANNYVHMLHDYSNDEVYTGVLRFADGRTATLSGYAKGSPFMMNIARSTENSVLEIRSDYFRHFIEALVEFFKNGTIPAPHSETLSIISAWGALMEAEKTPGIWVKVPKD